MQKKYKVVLIVIAFLIIFLSGITIYVKYFYETKDKIINKSTIVKDIEGYGYTLDDRDSVLMKEEFKILENILEEENINYHEYAKSISKLFVIDLFTIKNKINKYDVGGLEFILESEKDKFKNIILDSIYENVEDNSNHNRSQDLPEVINVIVGDVSESSYKLGDDTFESYVVELSWDYVKDLGYDKEASITLVKKENILYVVEYIPNIDVEEEIE